MSSPICSNRGCCRIRYRGDICKECYRGQKPRSTLPPLQCIMEFYQKYSNHPLRCCYCLNSSVSTVQLNGVPHINGIDRAHVHPKSYNNSHIANLVLSHSACNRSAGNMNAVAYQYRRNKLFPDEYFISEDVVISHNQHISSMEIDFVWADYNTQHLLVELCTIKKQ